MNEENKQILIRGLRRIGRTALWTLISVVASGLIMLSGELNLSPEMQGVVTLVLIPLLTGLDKMARDLKAW